MVMRTEGKLKSMSDPSESTDRPPNRLTKGQRIKKFFLRLGGWVPVFFVLALAVYTYYVYVVEYCCKLG